jgi:hypothetical protein
MFPLRTAFVICIDGVTLSQSQKRLSKTASLSRDGYKHRAEVESQENCQKICIQGQSEYHIEENSRRRKSRKSATLILHEAWWWIAICRGVEKPLVLMGIQANPTERESNNDSSLYGDEDDILHDLEPLQRLRCIVFVTVLWFFLQWRLDA